METGEADADRQKHHHAEHHRYTFLWDRYEYHGAKNRTHYPSDDCPMQTFDVDGVVFPEKNEKVQA